MIMHSGRVPTPQPCLSRIPLASPSPPQGLIMTAGLFSRPAGDSRRISTVADRRPTGLPAAARHPFGRILLVCSALSLAMPDGESPAQDVGFSKDIAPILVNHCGNCHIRGRKGDFQMQSYDQLIGSEKVSAGKPDESVLIRLVASGEMPPRGQVPAAEIEKLRKWVEQGAGFDGPDGAAALTSYAQSSGANRAGPVNRGDAQGYANRGTGGGSSGYDEMEGYGGAPGDGYGGGYGGGEMDGYGEGYDGAYGDAYGGDMGGYGDAGGYGGGYGAGGRRQASNPLAALLRHSVGGFDPESLLALTEPDAAPSGPVLSHEAEQAYAAGNLALAMQLYFGHIVAEFDQASDALASVRYSRTLLRPVWHTRWAVSMMVRGEDSVEELQPIEVGFATGKLKVDRRMMRGGRGAMAGRGAGGDAGYGDDYGSEGAAGGMASEIDYGEGYDELMGGGPGRRNQPEVPETRVEMLDAGVRDRFEKVLGMVTSQFESEFGGRYRDGQFGVALTTVAEVPFMAEAPGDAPAARPANAPQAATPRDPRVAAGGPGNPAATMGTDRGAARAAEAASMARERRRMTELGRYANAEHPMWMPGIVFLGEGPSAETLETARQLGIDVLLHFDVALKSAQQELTQNLSRCRVIHVASGKTLGVSKALDSLEAMRLVDYERTTEAEYVTEQLANLWQILDDKLSVMDMPTLTPEVAKRRVGALLAARDGDPLRTLAEIRLYQSQGLLTDAEVESAFELVAGDNGLVLLYGPLAQRLETVRQMAGAPD